MNDWSSDVRANQDAMKSHPFTFMEITQQWETRANVVN
jgi:hypothetical protein